MFRNAWTHVTHVTKGDFLLKSPRLPCRIKIGAVGVSAGQPIDSQLRIYRGCNLLPRDLINRLRVLHAYPLIGLESRKVFICNVVVIHALRQDATLQNKHQNWQKDQQ